MNDGLPRNYDAWVTGGDLHTKKILVICDNADCEDFMIKKEFMVQVEYGMIVDDLECPECGVVMDYTDRLGNK